MHGGKVTQADKYKSALMAAVGTALLLQLLVQPNVYAKRPSLSVPCNEKMVDGAGPETNDVSNKPSAGSTSLLAPLTLDSASGSVAPGGAEPVLKSTITATGFVPKGPIDPASKSVFSTPLSVGGKLGETDNLKKAKQVNVMPLPLLMSNDEAEKKIETVADSEKAELAELWESALGRSPDIQFVIQKLMPSSNPGHGATIIMRMLSTAVYGGMGAMQMMMPNAAGYMLSGTGGSAIMNVLNIQEGKIAKNARLSQTEAIMLYNMVRTTADRLVDNFRNYKKTVTSMQKATTDLQDLQGMVSESRNGQDASKQVEMEYTLRRQQRDVDGIGEDLHRFRQALVDLSGSEAVVKLDKQIEDEQNRIEQATPAGTPNSGTTPPREQTAENTPARG